MKLNFNSPNQYIYFQALNLFDRIAVEMKAGDALFFDCNLLHTSSRNNSDHRRWAFIIAYNKKKNEPYKPTHHANYRPLNKVNKYKFYSP